ncbi:VOC family protein [Paenibacillus wulumuqiensis]|uniref:VOC family protein n=1 Tax=Paenibacillus wulumuqiensis TaxID=1567107 RepID=UPI00061982FB|nr:VOC family protein [Paenibacillus wulumuqiensis]
MAVRKLEHVGIMVTSIEKSIAFYEQVIGLQHLETNGHVDDSIRLAFLAFPGHSETEVELVQGYTGALTEEGRVHHIAFTVDNIEEEYTRIHGLNLSNLDQQITTLPNGSRYFFFSGPDGERLEFFQSAR